MLQACLFRALTLLFGTVPYLHVLIVLRPSHSLLLVYASKYLYDKYLNNEIYENKVINSDAKTYLSFVLYLRVPSVKRFLLCTPTGDMNTLICELF